MFGLILSIYFIMDIFISIIVMINLKKIHKEKK